eukprot:TRINITY_DN9689_c0_g1_i1.p1 TRINITY_DN9689_c0_g1~~TRINITY_DN9689_c0_g1_i1.p1  ORF type:complete len:604 (+),score=160.59 TRINITY_DN9689_c0_g1_i1:42-1853(+)
MAKKKHHDSSSEESTKENIKEVTFGKILGQCPEEYWRMIVGSICSALNGATLPAFSVIFGEMFNDFFLLTGDALSDRILVISMFFLGLGVAAFILTYIAMSCWSIVGEKISRKLRSRYFDALMKQEIAYFDQHSSGTLTSRLSADIILIQGGISEKFGQIFYYGAQVLGGVIISFIYGWKMTLVMLAASPLMVIAGSLQTKALTSSQEKSQDAYAAANECATESISGARTVYSFVAESIVSDTYREHLRTVFKVGKKKAHYTGFGMGFSSFFMFGIYALGFWYGGKLIADGEMLPGDVLTVFFSIIIGAMGVGQGSQLSPDVAKAKGAAGQIFHLINRTPEIASGETRIKKMKGLIKFKKVRFTYPTRPDVTVLKKFSLSIKPGQTVALVGPSGGGKSTVMQLIERFYDPDRGHITVDGKQLTDLDLYSYRSHVGMVSQEPILFAGSIEDNIRYGRPDATFDEIEEAAIAANAYDFIVSQSDGFDTDVGESGTQLSGGQKQRIAIARAVLKNPQILLLDEATSALDAESERLVQDALDKLMEGRTTVVIAHRLTTIRNADKICVIDKGTIVEQGTHEDLVHTGGVYADLVHRQMFNDDNESQE